MNGKIRIIALALFVLMTVVGCASYDYSGSSSSGPCPAHRQCYVYSDAEGIGARNTCMVQSNCAAVRVPYPLPPNINVYCTCY
jgi:hypothetical protein